MKYGIYKDLYTKDSLSIFEFFSIGSKGVIAKRIIFEPTLYPDVYNLVLGDVDVNDQINDFTISDNGDRNKILATVVNVVEIYLKNYPERWVYFKGNTAEKTRLYRMAIGLNLEELSLKFDIYYQNGNDIFSFKKNTPTDSFLIRIKS